MLATRSETSTSGCANLGPSTCRTLGGSSHEFPYASQVSATSSGSGGRASRSYASRRGLASESKYPSRSQSAHGFSRARTKSVGHSHVNQDLSCAGLDNVTGGIAREVAGLQVQRRNAPRSRSTPPTAGAEVVLVAVRGSSAVTLWRLRHHQSEPSRTIGVHEYDEDTPLQLMERGMPKRALT